MFSDGPALKSLLEGEIRKLAEQLATGVCEDHGQYRHLVGVIEGLTRAIRVIDDYGSRLVNEMENQTEH